MESIWATLLSFLGEGQPIVKEGDLSLSAGCFESAARAILGHMAEAPGSPGAPCRACISGDLKCCLPGLLALPPLGR